MLERVHVMGAYWCEHSDTPTPLGALIAAAKDHESETALTALKAQFGDYVRSLDLHSATTRPAGDPAGRPEGDIVVVPVPNGTGRTRQLAPALAESAAEAIGATQRGAVRKRNVTVRLRDAPVQQRLALVEAAGYEVTGSVAGRELILVDDVILTGTTLNHLARLLKQAGTASVSAVVAARTRLAAPRGAAGGPEKQAQGLPA